MSTYSYDQPHRTVVDAAEHFAARRSVTNSVFSTIGRVFTERMTKRQIDEAEAVTYGRRRATVAVMAVGAIAAASGLTMAVVAGNAATAEQQDNVNACATRLSGHKVDLRLDPQNGTLMVPADVLSEVNACRTAGGDVSAATYLLDHPN